MKIFYHTIQTGTFLKIQHEDNTFYGEYSPWIELGYKPISKLNKDSTFIKSIIKTYKKNQILPKELSFQCHQLVKDIKKADLPIYKIKLHSNDPKESALFLIKLFNQFEFQARLDFNSKWKLEEVLQLFKRLNGHHKRIEYIEDPIPFNIAKWEKLKQEQVPLAIDHHFNQTGEVPSFVENVIYRPYFSSHWEEELQNKKIIVTQNFSHAWNYYSSLIYAQDYPNQTHGLYPSSEIQYNKKGNLFNIDMSLFEQLNNKMNELQWQIF